MIAVDLPEDLVARIDDLARDRAAFVTEAVRKALRESQQPSNGGDLNRINELADKLNREAADVLEYQTIAWNR